MRINIRLTEGDAMSNLDSPRSVETSESDTALRLHNVSKIYPGTVALQKVKLV